MKENNTYHEHSEEANFPDLPCGNPFSVPENYFANAENHLATFVKFDRQHNDPGFGTPENYFAQLQNAIIFQTKLDRTRSTVEFTTPSNYFEELSASVFNKISEEKLKQKVSNAGFIIDENHFQDAERNILAMAKMDTLRSENGGFDVKDNYFDELTQNIKSKTFDAEKKPTIIRSIGFNKWSKYAAACVIAIISVSVYFGLNSKNSTTDQEISFNGISDEELKNYLAMNNDEDDLYYFAEYIYQNDAEHDHGQPGHICSGVEDHELEAYIKEML